MTLKRIKELLVKFRKRDDLDATSYMAGINSDKILDETARELLEAHNAVVKEIFEEMGKVLPSWRAYQGVVQALKQKYPGGK